MNTIQNWANKRPHVSTAILLASIILLSIASIGFMSVIPALFAAIIFALGQPHLSYMLSKREQIGYFGWAIIGGCFIASALLALYQPEIENWLAWWAFVISVMLSATTIGTLTWTVYTTQSERSEKLQREKKDQPKRITSMIASEYDKETDAENISISVWNGSDMPIFDVHVGFASIQNPDSQDPPVPHYKQISSIPARTSKSIKLADEEQEKVRSLGIVDSVPAVAFKDASGHYWIRGWDNELLEIQPKYFVSVDAFREHLIYLVAYQKVN